MRGSVDCHLGDLCPVPELRPGHMGKRTELELLRCNGKRKAILSKVDDFVTF